MSADLPPVPPAVVEFAKSCGFNSVESAGEWKDYNVYYLPVDEKGFSGLPNYILQKDNEIRLNRADETYQIMNPQN